MKKLIIFFAGTLVFLVIISFNLHNQKQENIFPFSTTFIEDNNGTLKEAKFVFWQEIDKDITKKQAFNNINIVSKKLGVDNNSIIKQEEESYQIVNKVDDNNICYKVSLIKTNSEAKLIITAEVKENIEAIKLLLTKINKVLKNNYNYNYLVMTTLDGKYNFLSTNKVINNSLFNLDVKSIEKVITNNYYSESFYFKNINQYVLSNNKKINIQIASDYIEKEDKTYFYYGVPMLYNDF